MIDFAQKFIKILREPKETRDFGDFEVTKMGRNSYVASIQYPPASPKESRYFLVLKNEGVDIDLSGQPVSAEMVDRMRAACW